MGTKKRKIAKTMQTDLFTTLQQCKEFLGLFKSNGCKCPCCGSYIKVWRKKPISTAIVAFIKLCNLYKNDPKFYHLDDFNVIQKDRNFNQLTLWGIVEPNTDNETEKRAFGEYKPTKLGLQWYSGEVKIPKYVYTQNNVLKYKDTENFITLQDAVSSKFKYDQLMDGNYPLT